MAGKGQFKIEGYDWTGLWTTDLPAIIKQEAPAWVNPGALSSYLNKMDLAYKAGNYNCAQPLPARPLPMILPFPVGLRSPSAMLAGRANLCLVPLLTMLPIKPILRLRSPQPKLSYCGNKFMPDWLPVSRMLFTSRY